MQIAQNAVEIGSLSHCVIARQMIFSIQYLKFVKIVPRNVIPVPTNKIFVKLAR
jgi:hypothetical protein